MSLSMTESLTRQDTKIGQFLTPSYVATFMASMLGALPSTVRLLDAGCGAGALTAAVVARCCEGRDSVTSIVVTLYEIDAEILPLLRSTLQTCSEKCSRAGIHFAFTVRNEDFIQQISSRISNDLFSDDTQTFDVAIVNPPYKKINTDSASRRALRSVGIETSNLYTGFIALIHRVLIQGGQLVAITPRSFCNGPYFRSFREDLLANVQLKRIHVYDSRRAAFRNANVLQENIIFHAVKSRKKPSLITISSSSGEEQSDVAAAMHPFDDIVHPSDPEKFIHIPSSVSHSTAKASLQGLNTSLTDLGIRVSTGRVVDFRAKDALRQNPVEGSVPLLYPSHFSDGQIAWPKPDSRKPNAIIDNHMTRSSLVPAGIYVLTKRFTSKEERKRIVACLFNPESVQHQWIGIENHLNYFHANGKGLPENLAKGLFAFLNSTVLDEYFRRFSGHTQVNATDLRTLAYPDAATLERIGRYLKTPYQSQQSIDQLIDRYLIGSRNGGQRHV